MQAMVDGAGLQDQVKLDSAGTGGWHAGELPDSRMRKHAAKRGYQLTMRARQVRSTDFMEFDLILVMDRQNLRDIREFAAHSLDMKNVRNFCDFVEARKETEVPDPYYGAEDGFEEVLDLVEDGCAGLLRMVQQKLA
jgi:protein-tyrosine phosphatase